MKLPLQTLALAPLLAPLATAQEVQEGAVVQPASEQVTAQIVEMQPVDQGHGQSVALQRFSVSSD